MSWFSNMNIYFDILYLFNAIQSILGILETSHTPKQNCSELF